MLLALAAPAVVYATYPQAVAEAVEAASEMGVSSPRRDLGGLGAVYTSLEALRGYRGHVGVSGVVERAWMHMALVDTGEGGVSVTLMGCWRLEGVERVVPGFLVARQLAPGASVLVYGHYMETHMGPVLVAEELEAPGLEAVRVECPGQQGGAWGPMSHGGMQGPMHGWGGG